jgi:hypothetical protein
VQAFHNFDVEISSTLTVYVNISDDRICIHILLRCSISRHHIYEKLAYCAQLLLVYYVQPDDGHHKGRNMSLLATSVI